MAAVALGGCGGSDGSDRTAAAAEGVARLAVVLPDRDALALVDPNSGVISTVRVGASPWDVAVAGNRAYVSAARHVAVVDLRSRRVLARIPYRTPVPRVERGEYRAGGMGIVADAPRRRVYVGVNAADGGAGALELLDTRRLRNLGSVRTGIRPFDVLLASGGGNVYTVDHDSYGVTAVNVATRRARFLPVAPLGRGAFDKLNYGAVDAAGRLLLPINGEVLAVLDPATGRVDTRPMRSRIHQAGVTLSRGRLLTVGAEALDPGSRPNLSIYDVGARRERVLPLRRPHEAIAVSRDGRLAYLTGGYTRGGWSGISVVTLATGRVRELPLPAPPLGIATLP